MIGGRILGALTVEADDTTASDIREPAGQMPLPTLDERANFYLRAVHGDRDFANEEYSRARDVILKAMAADIATRSNIRSPNSASPSPQVPEHSTTLPNPFLEIGTSKSSYEPSTVNDSAG